MKLTIEQKNLIRNYFVDNILFQYLTIELIYKTISDLNKLLNISGLKIAFVPNYGSNEKPKPEGDLYCFDLCLIMPKPEDDNQNIYIASAHPTPTGVLISIEEDL